MRMLRRRAFILPVNQAVADAALAVAVGAEVPVAPALALHVVHDLRGIIQVVNVVLFAGWIFAQLFDAVLQSGVFRADAAVLTTQQTNRGHGERGRLTRQVGKVAALVGRALLRTLHGIEEALGQPQRVLGHTQAGHLPALEGHQLPAGYGRIAGLLGSIAPAAASVVLSRSEEHTSELQRQLDARIGSQAVCLTHGDGGDTVRVHIGAVRTILTLFANQPVN